MKTIFSLLLIILSFHFGISQNSENCNCCSEDHKNFDFWVGRWEVRNPDGSPAGSNVIEKVQDNCVLKENWVSARSGYTGTSYNFFNSQTGNWEQVWIDNQGQSLHMSGNREGNKMILKTEWQTDRSGNSFFHRISWTLNDDGSVRQLWETINDNKQVTIAFDGLYKRAKE